MPVTVPTPDDVFQGVVAKLSADGGFATQFPGGGHFGRRVAAGPFPYLVGTVEEREPTDVSSDGSYLQTFVAELTAWCESTESAAAATGAARAWLDARLNGNPAAPAAGVSVPNCVKTMWLRPAGGSLRLSPELRNGRDVLAAGKRIEVAVEGKY